jgi:N-acetylmuramoyl-L-alanine amidase
MPAVLAEIAFISNPTDEKLLKTTKFRQEVAEHLFKGISGYADSLGNTSAAQKKNPEGM